MGENGRNQQLTQAFKISLMSVYLNPVENNLQRKIPNKTRHLHVITDRITVDKTTCMVQGVFRINPPK